MNSEETILCEEIFQKGKCIDSWAKENIPDEDLIYKDGCSHQLSKFKFLADLLSAEVKIVENHTSKSVTLPVACFKFAPYDQVFAYCFIRDNFHDIKLSVVSDGPTNIPYHLIYSEMSEGQYSTERKDCIEYRAKTISERLKLKDSDLYQSLDWYSTWSGGKLLVKEDFFNKKIFKCSQIPHSCYCEGINKLNLPNEVFRVYESDMKIFSINLHSYGQLVHVMEYVERSLEKERYAWNDRKRAEGNNNEGIA